jgi:hypothetical protein
MRLGALRRKRKERLPPSTAPVVYPNRLLLAGANGTIAALQAAATVELARRWSEIELGFDFGNVVAEKGASCTYVPQSARMSSATKYSTLWQVFPFSPQYLGKGTGVGGAGGDGPGGVGGSGPRLVSHPLVTPSTACCSMNCLAVIRHVLATLLNVQAAQPSVALQLAQQSCR